MAVPGSLPQRIYLLAHNPAKGRVGLDTNLGAMLRAAALAELYLAGRLVDERGRAVARADQHGQPSQPSHHGQHGHGSHAGDDPVLAAMLHEIAGSRPRKWQHWVGRGHRAAVRAVREQLGDGGWVRLEPRRVLGLFPVTRVTVRDPRVRKELLGRVRAALTAPVGTVELADAALVAIVAAGDLSLVLDRKARRAGKRRIKELTERSGPVGRALRNSIAAAAAAAAG